MMHCSDKARALCPDRDYCGRQERGDYTADSWCGGFNAGVAKAMEAAVDLTPLIHGIEYLVENFPVLIRATIENLPELLKEPAFQAALAKLKEGSDGRT